MREHHSGEPATTHETDETDVSHAYDRWAVQYDADHNATRDLDAEVVRRAPLRVAGRDVLELGSGTGKNTLWLAERARHVHALDFSGGMLAEARRRVQRANVSFAQHDVRVRWPFATASMDVVVGNLVLEHVRELAPIHAEAARVLRPGGQLFLCELHPYRQLRGGQAHFVDQASGQTIHVPVFPHSTSEYVNGGLAAGFVLRELGEWLEPEAAADAPPRLLSVLFERP
jgi:ubiquinone/menaquinone biosynthesis C-methylase UbiE